jgi:hypothetical protein
LRNRRWAVLAVALAACGPAAACGSDRHPHASGAISALVAESRPIGPSARFRPPVSGRPLGGCTARLGSRVGVHVELFAANLVVLLPAGIGAEPPFRYSSGRIAGARCFSALVTLDPTGVVLVRRGARLDLSDLFRSWGEPLSPTRLASFSTHAPVAVFVDGRPWRGNPRDVPLSPHAEIVLEVGPHVPPHSTYQFPPGT